MSATLLVPSLLKAPSSKANNPMNSELSKTRITIVLQTLCHTSCPVFPHWCSYWSSKWPAVLFMYLQAPSRTHKINELTTVWKFFLEIWLLFLALLLAKTACCKMSWIWIWMCWHLDCSFRGVWFPRNSQQPFCEGELPCLTPRVCRVLHTGSLSSAVSSTCSGCSSACPTAMHQHKPTVPCQQGYVPQELIVASCSPGWFGFGIYRVSFAHFPFFPLTLWVP